MRTADDTQPVTLTTRRPERTRRWALLVTLPGILFVSIPLHALDSFDDTDYIEVLKERERGVGWNISPGVSGGLTIPLDGYENYDNSPNASLDIYFRPPVPQFPEWPDRMMFRLSGEYFPLEVPSEVKGVVEDLYALTGTVLFRLMRMDGMPEHKRWIPYVGGGAGVFWDRIKLDYPGMPSTDSVDTFFGLTGSAGILVPAIGPIRIVPEVRYYSFKRSNGIWANHLSYQIGLVYWLPSKMEE